MEVIIRRLDAEWVSINGVTVRLAEFVCVEEDGSGRCGFSLSETEKCINPRDFNCDYMKWRCRPDGHLTDAKVRSPVASLTVGQDVAWTGLDEEWLAGFLQRLKRLQTDLTEKGLILEYQALQSDEGQILQKQTKQTPQIDQAQIEQVERDALLQEGGGLVLDVTLVREE